jgi:hypothetical protein
MSKPKIDGWLCGFRYSSTIILYTESAVEDLRSQYPTLLIKPFCFVEDSKPLASSEVPIPKGLMEKVYEDLHTLAGGGDDRPAMVDSGRRGRTV